jgi:hypothetical protein
MVAAVAHLTTIAHHFVENGADLEAQTSLEDTVLHLVAEREHPHGGTPHLRCWTDGLGIHDIILKKID